MIKCVLDVGAFKPQKAHVEDAGFDIRTPVAFTVPPTRQGVGESVLVGMATIDTGIHVEIPEGFVGMLKSKSGLNVKRNVLSEGVVDSGYTGSIRVKLYNFGDRPVDFAAGDKITQLVIMPIGSFSEFEIVDSISGSSRGDSGFGSTGK